MPSQQILYSDKYYDDKYEYRHVHVPPEIAKSIPKDKLMSEAEWRALGVQQSHGWCHYLIWTTENVIPFRRPIQGKPPTQEEQLQMEDRNS